MTPRYTVSILTYTALRQVKGCLTSVLKSTVPFKLILTANGNPLAADFFHEIEREFPFVTVIVNEKNEGYIEPQKKAFSLCETELFVMLNDDTIVPPNFLEKLGAEFDKFPTAALSAPKGGCQSLQTNFHGFSGPAFEYLNGACLCCKTELMRKHGLFDPNLTFAYGDDADLSLRMRELGYTLHYADFTLLHEVSATSRSVREVRVHQEANHVYLRRRWAHYLAHRKMEFPVVIRRGAAFGDVLLTTPIVRAMRALRPLSPLYVETSCPQIYANNPHVKAVDRRSPRMVDAMIFVLDGSYENNPGKHIVASYAERCGIALTDYHTELYLSSADETHADATVPGDNWVAIHSGPSTWRSKEWPIDRFALLVCQLQAQGFRVVAVGSPGKTVGEDLNKRGQTTVQQMAAIIKRAKLFIGLDSLPFHVAESVGTPAIGLFGITDPKFISTRDFGAMCVCATVPSFGLRHRVKGVTAVDDGGEAMRSITVEMVMAKAHSILVPKEAVAS